MVGGAFKIGREHPTKEKVIMSVDCYSVLELTEMKEGVGGSRAAIEGGITNFLGNRSLVISLDSDESEGLIPICSIPFRDCWLTWLSRF